MLKTCVRAIQCCVGPFCLRLTIAVACHCVVYLFVIIGVRKPYHNPVVLLLLFAPPVSHFFTFPPHPFVSLIIMLVILPLLQVQFSWYDFQFGNFAF